MKLKKINPFFVLIVVFPWISYFSLVKDFLLLYYLSKVVIPLLLALLSLYFLAAKGILSKVEFRFLILLCGFLTIGLFNGSLQLDPSIYGRFLWILGLPALTIFFYRRIQFEELDWTYKVLYSTIIFLLSIYFYFSYLSNNNLTDAVNSSVFVSNLDKGDYVRLPTTNSLVLMCFALAAYMQKKYLLSVTLLCCSFYIQYLGFSRMGMITAVMYPFLFFITVKLFKLGLKYFFYSLFAFQALFYSSRFFALAIERFAETSLAVRHMSSSYALDLLLNKPMYLLLGAGMFSRDHQLNLYPEFFYPSDLGLLGFIFEFGLPMYVLFVAILLGVLRRSLQLISENRNIVILAILSFAAITIINSIFGYFIHNALALCLSVASISAIGLVHKRNTQ